MKTSLLFAVFALLLSRWANPCRATDIVWTNVNGGNWSVAANWSPNQVPGSADNVFITNNGTYTVILNTSATIAGFELGGETGTQRFTNSSQVLTLNGPGAVGTNGVFGLTGGTLNGSGDLSIGGELIWSGGTMGGSGRTMVGSSALLRLNGGTKTLRDSRALLNAGQATWSAGGIVVPAGSSVLVSNAAGGTIEVTFAASFSGSTGTRTIANGGLFRMNAGTTADLDIAFNNNGTVQVQNGTLVLRGGGTHSGHFGIAAGATLAFGGATNNMNASSSVANSGTLLLNGATVNVNEDIEVGGIATLSAGRLAGTGTLTASGTFNWTGGLISGSVTMRIAGTGGFNLSGTGGKQFQGTHLLVNEGHVTWSGGAITVADSPPSDLLISNAPSGVFDITFAASFTGTASPETIVNAGLFRMNASGTTATLQIRFDNLGTVQVQSGTLGLSGFGMHNGSFLVDQDAALAFSGGTNNLNPGSSISGTGNMLCSGVVNVNTNLATSTPMILSAGRLGGTGTLVVNDNLSWTGGLISDSVTLRIASTGTLNLSGTGTKQFHGTHLLVNEGHVTWSGGLIIVADSPPSNVLISNAPSGVFDITFAASFTATGAPKILANAGWVRMNASGANADLDITVNNTGTVQVQNGTFGLKRGGTHTGSFEIASGTTLAFTGGTHFLNGGSSVANSGTLLIGTGTVNVNENIEVGSTVTLSGGTLAGTGTLTANGVFNWTTNVSTMGGSGVTRISGGASLNVSGSFKQLDGSRLLVNEGHAIWSGGTGIDVDGIGVVISNAPGGIFEVTAGGGFGGLGTAVFVNDGIFRLLGGSLAISETFNNRGTVELRGGGFNLSSGSFVQSAGLTLLDGGNFTNSTPLQIEGGILAGSGFITGSVTNKATVRAGSSPGQLIIMSAYNQTANGLLEIELAGTTPGIDFDRLIVGQAARLDGALNVSLAGGFYPAPAAAFTFLTCGSRSGVFAHFSWPSNEVGMTLNYTPTNVTVVVTNVITNLPPVIASLTNQVIDELTPLTVSVNATDDNTPAHLLTYSLSNAPPAAVIDTNGVISWTPTEEQGPSTNVVTVFVIDAGNLSASTSFEIVVNEVNVAPFLFPLLPRTINEQTAFNLNVPAADTDIPPNDLVFELVSGPPGLTVSTSGATQWTPGEAQGSNVYTVTFRVTDHNTNAVNTQQLSRTNSLTIMVHEVNLPPTLAVPADQVIAPDMTLNVSATATDPDVPTNALTFALVAGPTGLTVSPSGAIAWSPSISDAGTTNAVTVSVTDSNPDAVNAQQLSVTNSFIVTVSAALAIRGRVAEQNGTGLSGVTINLAGAATNRTAFTDGNGNYEFSSVAAGNYMLTPGKSNFVFSPTNANVSVSAADVIQDFVAQRIGITISGRITNCTTGTGLSNVRLYANGVLQALTDVDGNYSIPSVVASNPFYVGPSALLMRLTPAWVRVIPTNDLILNFCGQAYPSVWGRVTNRFGGGISGVTVRLSGAIPRQTVTSFDGSYAFYFLSPGNCTVTPTNPGYAFGPLNQSFTNLTTNATACFLGTPTFNLPGKIVINGSSAVVLDADGVGSLRWPFPSLDYSWSPDGSRITFAAAPYASLHIANADGSGKTNIYASPVYSPIWSPDGSHIAFVRLAGTFMSQLWTVSTNGSNPTFLTTANGAPITWSQDGSRIAFSRQTRTEVIGTSMRFYFDMFTINRDGTGLTRLTTNGTSFSHPAWSPDGKWIAYTKPTNGWHTYFLNPTDGTSTLAISNTSRYFGTPWSPDGRTLAFARNEGGSNAVYFISTNGGAPLFFEYGYSSSHAWGRKPSKPTPMGFDVSAELFNTTVTFSNVTSAGSTTINPVSPQAYALPSGYFGVSGLAAYEISTTASNQGPITVCFTVPGWVTQDQFDRLRVFHGENGALVDRTILPPDFATHTICAQVASLSPFVIAEQIDPALPQIAGVVLDDTGLPLSDVPVALSGDHTAEAFTDVAGQFFFANLQTTGSYTVTAVDRRYLLEPATINIPSLGAGADILFVGTVAPPPPVPPLAIALDSRFDNLPTLTWPGNPFDFLLESTDSLSSPNWLLAPDPALPVTEGVAVPLPPIGIERYFRLRRP